MRRPVQLRHETALTSEAYLAEHAWEKASLRRCPRHPAGGCGFARHGTYSRKTPAGMRVTRYYCPTAHETFSLLPDCLASRFPSDLDALEHVAVHVASSRSVEAAADVLRPEIELPSAVRWIRRRLTAVRTSVVLLAGLLGVGVVDATLDAFRAVWDTDPGAGHGPLAGGHAPGNPAAPARIRSTVAATPRAGDSSANTRWGLTGPARPAEDPPDRRDGGQGGPMPHQTDVTTHAETVALFRYGLIADLRELRPGDRSLHARLEEKAAREYDIPGTTRRHVAPGTLREWLYAYRRGGFDALKPRPRRDVGRARALPQAVADALCTLKEEAPTFSVMMLVATARQRGVIPADLEVAPATVHRLLTRQGLMVRPPQTPTSKDRRRFSFALANDLWMSDVMHGPSVLDEEDRRRHKTYLDRVARRCDARRAARGLRAQ